MRLKRLAAPSAVIGRSPLKEQSDRLHLPSSSRQHICDHGLLQLSPVPRSPFTRYDPVTASHRHIFHVRAWCEENHNLTFSTRRYSGYTDLPLKGSSVPRHRDHSQAARRARRQLVLFDRLQVPSSYHSLRNSGFSPFDVFLCRFPRMRKRNAKR